MSAAAMIDLDAPARYPERLISWCDANDRTVVAPRGEAAGVLAPESVCEACWTAITGAADRSACCAAPAWSVWPLF